MMVHAFNLNSQKAEVADLYGFEASLIYIVSSRTALHSETLPQINKQTNKHILKCILLMRLKILGGNPNFPRINISQT